jgi:hypothetical protein
VGAPLDPKMNGYIVLYFRNRSGRAKLQELARRYVTADQGTERLAERALQVLSDNPSLLDERDDNRAMIALVHKLAQEQLQITGVLSRCANGDAT